MRLGFKLLNHFAGRSSNLGTQFPSSNQKMSRRVLLAFDFDHTVVDGNTDVVAQNLIPVIPQSTKDLYHRNSWIQYMEKIFEHLHHEGITPDQILEAIRNIPEVPGMLLLLQYLRRPDCEVVIISDSNSTFISTWLEKHRLSDVIKHVYTNPAEFDASGQLHVNKYHVQNWCTLSSVNLCKGHILETHISSRKEGGTNFTDIVYVGDGHNDLCPSLRLSSSDYVFVRSGYALEKIIRTGPLEHGPVKAKVLFWRTGGDILETIENSIIKDGNSGA